MRGIPETGAFENLLLEGSCPRLPSEAFSYFSSLPSATSGKRAHLNPENSQHWPWLCFISQLELSQDICFQRHFPPLCNFDGFSAFLIHYWKQELTLSLKIHSLLITTSTAKRSVLWERGNAAVCIPKHGRIFLYLCHSLPKQIYWHVPYMPAASSRRKLYILTFMRSEFFQCYLLWTLCLATGAHHVRMSEKMKETQNFIES